MMALAWLFLGLLFGLCGCALIEWRCHFPLDQLADLTAVLRCVDNASLESLLDAHKEADLRCSLPAKEFRQKQDTRIYQASEYLRRRQFNAILILNWAYGQLEKLPKDNPDCFENKSKILLLHEIIEAATRYITYADFALLKLRMWSLLRIDRWVMLPTPSLADLREVLGIDGLHAYERLTSAIGYLSLFYGERCYDNLMLALHGRIPITD